MAAATNNEAQQDDTEMPEMEDDENPSKKPADGKNEEKSGDPPDAGDNSDHLWVPNTPGARY